MNATRIFLRHRAYDGPWLLPNWMYAMAAVLCVAAATAADAWSVEGAAEPTSPQEWYGAGVRPTGPRTPQQQRAGFHLPAGFEIRLFAAEPQIAKPMNLAFDARGRLWVTQSEEYPYPVADGAPGRDQIRVLEDTDGDGRADQVTVFADGLNIPIGVLPYGDGCICFSIPYLWYLRDTDGDGRCDRREKILGPFDTSRDTHGMVNSLRRGADGWIYACHGFNNQSTVAGRDGHAVQMTSGNTFRFRPDGSRVELYSRGQVNPFGMTFDQWGNPYTADCHSKPISQLIRGGSYPSFGRPHDGLGFVPPMLDHLHGSTAIAGLAYLPPGGSPAALAGDFLSGNVMTSRINRNRLVWHGATARGEALPDFLTSDDPWFRPVDLRWGPDGFLYVADFYNKIIGHYEVPLDHPGRDRHRGRIWQIRAVADGAADASSTAPAAEPRETPPQRLVASLRGANPTRFALALDRLTEDAAAASDDWLSGMIRQPPHAMAAVAALWALQRRGRLDDPTLCDALRSTDPLVQVHALRIVGQRDEKGSDAMPRPVATVPSAAEGDASTPRAMASSLLHSQHPQVACAAALAAGLQPRAADLPPLLRLIVQAPDDDPILRQTARIAVRDTLIDAASGPASYAWLRQQLQPQAAVTPELRQAALTMQGIPDAQAAAFLLDYLRRSPGDPDAGALLAHAARHAGDDDQARAVELARMQAGDDPAQQARLIQLLFEAGGAQPRRMQPSLRRWAIDHLTAQLRAIDAAIKGHAGRGPVAWTATAGGAWPHQRQQRSNIWPMTLASSLPLGETYTGQFRSAAFTAPPHIAFWIAGHNGPRDAADAKKNKVRLVDDRTGDVLREALPPRHDQAVRVEWSLGDAAGTRVRLELVDQHAATAYAWIAVGGFDPPWLEPPAGMNRLQTALQIVAAYDLSELRSPLEQMAGAPQSPPDHRLLIATCLAQLDRDGVLRGLAEVARQQSLDQATADAVVATAVAGRSPTDDLVQQVCQQLALDGQRQLASVWSESDTGVIALLEAIDRGTIAPEVLRDKQVDQRLQAVSLDAAQAERLEQLRARAASGDQQLAAQLADLLQTPPTPRDAGRGGDLFKQHCAACHQIAGQGSLVGPQLDGVGRRGTERLLEDILAPDRNVDRAFRTTTLLTDDGRVVVGLVTPESDGRLAVVGTDGTTQHIAAESVVSRRENATSLMPGNFGELFTADQVHDLLHYLRTQPSR